MDRSSMDISTFGESSQWALAFFRLRTTDFEISATFTLFPSIFKNLAL